MLHICPGHAIDPMGHLLNMKQHVCFCVRCRDLPSLPCGLLSIIACLCRTLFAPTNAAFESPGLKARTGLTAAQFLEPANKEPLIKVRPLLAHVDALATGCSDTLHCWGGDCYTSTRPLTTSLPSPTRDRCWLPPDYARHA